jgi:hypothetical protein
MAVSSRAYAPVVMTNVAQSRPPCKYAAGEFLSRRFVLYGLPE